jgi:hypothetical protein
MSIDNVGGMSITLNEFKVYLTKTLATTRLPR